MKKSILSVTVVLLLVILAGSLLVYLYGQNGSDGVTPSPTPAATSPPTPTPILTPQPTSTPTTPATPTIYTYTIINTYPHQTDAFTQGLVFDNGVLYESIGLYGASALRRVNVENGAVLKQVDLPSQYFAEGLALVNDSLIQLTWQNGIGFVWDKESFALKGNFSYAGEGWGLTFDGNHLIMSNGSSSLTFLDPVTYQITGQVNVKDGNTPLVNLNELEYVNGDIYANIWIQQKIAIINPQTGQVTGYIDLTGLYQPQGGEDVLNGIAYDSQTNRLFVTGKNWPQLYQITIQPKT